MTPARLADVRAALATMDRVALLPVGVVTVGDHTDANKSRRIVVDTMSEALDEIERLRAQVDQLIGERLPDAREIIRLLDEMIAAQNQTLAWQAVAMGERERCIAQANDVAGLCGCCSTRERIVLAIRSLPGPQLPR